MSKSHLKILLLSLLAIPPLILLVSQKVLPTGYGFSSVYKLLFLFPVVFRVVWERKRVRVAFAEHFSLRAFKKHLRWTVLAGIGMAGVYVGVFFLVRGFIDFGSIVSQLQDSAEINATNLIFIGAYVIVLNSLLEEFFWRGFLFDKLEKIIAPWAAYLMTGIAFSFHHIVFYYNWFTPGFFLIATLGLSGYAVVMNLIFKKTGDLFSCWLVHAFADVAQIAIGLMIFGML